MSAFIGILGFFVFAFGVFQMVISLFKKKTSKKKALVLIVAGIILFIVGVSIPSGSTSTAETEATKVKSESSSSTSSKEKDEANKEVFNVGDTVDIKGYQIKVNDVKYSDSEGYSTPDEGKQFVIINLTITNKTDKKVSFNPLDFSLNENGVSSTTGFTYVDGVDVLSSGDLDPDASVTGNLVGQAAPDSKLKLRYEGNMFLKNKEVDINLR
ncbi:DUF4352 domain-containing protein [uncultured Enterococcus sp.]|uniref:DUF4352 domain-containing protein n=1 Tax=uncultured Enterococcus sp. TaxID=167972 RepID=UPI002592DC97|nr:DUF4352 domain-containing protein [uncultured Enterococcus sp.]